MGETAGLVVVVIGVLLGRLALAVRERRRARALAERVRAELATAEVLTLPELVTRVGLRDGLLARGRVMNVVRPMVEAGELVQEEPPGTTVRTRLSVLRFRRAGAG